MLQNVLKLLGCVKICAQIKKNDCQDRYATLKVIPDEERHSLLHGEE